MFRKVLAVLAGCLLSGVAFSGHPGDDVAMPLTVPVEIPQQTGSWIVGIEALYLESNNHDFHFALTRIDQTFLNGMAQGSLLTHHTRALEPDHEWGVRGDVAYLFAGNGRDVRLTWTHFHEVGEEEFHNVEGYTSTAIPTDITSPGAIFMNPITGWDEIDAKFYDNYDAIDVVFGQEMEFGQRLSLHAFGGLRYADINTKVRGTYHSPLQTISGGNEVEVNANFSLRSDFEGLGPRAGMDTEIHLQGDLSIVGMFAGSLLVGDQDQNYNAFAIIESQTMNSAQVMNFQRQLPSKTVVVPELDARIGLKYVHPLSPRTALGVELGYEVTNYFNEVDNSIVSYTDSMAHPNDHADQGLYLRFEYHVA